MISSTCPGASARRRDHLTLGESSDWRSGWHVFLDVVLDFLRAFVTLTRQGQNASEFAEFIRCEASEPACDIPGQFVDTVRYTPNSAAVRAGADCDVREGHGRTAFTFNAEEILLYPELVAVLADDRDGCHSLRPCVQPNGDGPVPRACVAVLAGCLSGLRRGLLHLVAASHERTLRRVR